MPSYTPPKKGAEYIFYISLAAQAQANTFQSNPTIASGDFKVSIDGGALNNLATLPAVTPAASKMVKVTLSTSEMNGDNITLVGSDAAGAEWRDVVVNIQTSPVLFDDLPTAAEIADAVMDDGVVEPTDVPDWPTTLREVVGWLFALSRNKITQSSTTRTLRNDADSGDIATATISESGGVFTTEEWS